MGNIRQTYIKRVAIELVKEHSGEFTKEYQHNKYKVGEMTDVKNNVTRNRIAGYVTNLKKREEIY